MGCEGPEEAITMFRQMMAEMGLGNPVAVNRGEELEVLSTSVNPVRLKNNPISIDEGTAKTLYSIIVI